MNVLNSFPCTERNPVKSIYYLLQKKKEITPVISMTTMLIEHTNSLPESSTFNRFLYVHYKPILE